MTIAFDSTSPFVIGVMSILDTIRSPMHDLQTAYKQQNYSLPYVVSQLLLIKNYIMGHTHH
jgi:hypothetical protein